MKNKYKIILEIAGKKYEAEGDTVSEAFLNIPLKWSDIKAKGVITVTKDNHSVSKIFYLAQLRKMFGNKLSRLMRTMWANRLELLFTKSNDNL